MFVASYHHTMAGAVTVTPKRDRVIALATSWASARESEANEHANRIRRENCRTPVPRPQASARELIELVAVWHGLTYDDIVGRANRRAWAQARRDAIVAIRRARPHLSLCQIGAIFRRDHTTIIHHLESAGVE